MNLRMGPNIVKEAWTKDARENRHSSNNSSSTEERRIKCGTSFASTITTPSTTTTTTSKNNNDKLVDGFNGWSSKVRRRLEPPGISKMKGYANAIFSTDRRTCSEEAPSAETNGHIGDTRAVNGDGRLVNGTLRLPVSPGRRALRPQNWSFRKQASLQAPSSEIYTIPSVPCSPNLGRQSATPVKTTRRICKVDSINYDGYVKLNQYKLMSEIGQVNLAYQRRRECSF